jgi:hypothetical protein
MPRYVLREVDRHGRLHSEEFDAPDDKAALTRIKGETRGRRYELWCGDELVDEGKPKRL